MKTALPVEKGQEAPSEETGLPEALKGLSVRVRGEYQEMPGMRLTVRQAARLFDMPPDVADAVLHELRRASVLALSSDGAYSLIAEPSRWTRTANAAARNRREEPTT
jgi:hypothetical protein